MMRSTFFALPLLLSIVLEQASAEAYPDRPAKKIVVKLCGTCHGLKLMESMRRTREQWQTTVDDMLTLGMNAQGEEVNTVVNYFATYLSRLNLNKASAAELTDVLEISASQSAILVDYRQKNGPFKNFDALEKVPGLEIKKLSEQRDRIGFTPAAR